MIRLYDVTNFVKRDLFVRIFNETKDVVRLINTKVLLKSVSDSLNPFILIPT